MTGLDFIRALAERALPPRRRAEKRAARGDEALATVPHELAAKIAAAMAFDRGEDGAGMRRIAVTFRGGGGIFLHEAPQWLELTERGLTAAQRAAAVRMLTARAAACLERAAIDQARREGAMNPAARWSGWRPLAFPPLGTRPE